MNFAGAGDRGDEGRFVSTAKAAHFVEGQFERCGHVLARHVTGGEDKLADGMNFQGVLFEQVVAYAFVAGEEYPTVGANQRKPRFIECSGRKVVQVALEAHGELGQRIEDRAGVAKIFVEIKNEVVRRRWGEGARAPSGWLLRSPAACGHILRRARR